MSTVENHQHIFFVSRPEWGLVFCVTRKVGLSFLCHAQSGLELGVESTFLEAGTHRSRNKLQHK